MFQPSANAAIVMTRPTELITTAGIYQVAIIFGNDDSQSASCSVAVMASGPPTSISAIQGPIAA